MEELRQQLGEALPGSNQPKTLSGIETGICKPWCIPPGGSNQPKTLSGIETLS